ncbi:MAG: A/G-specific adenine glycosylase [Eubacteriales bacterium]|nr:A/G-specific adenine glycosylase [Eubacteriales bacterium]
MKYERIKRATFLERPNRFIAYAEIAGKKETIHVKNTGRCAELLVPEAEIFVQESDNPDRKTKWDLIGVKKGERLINMDSQIPNQVVGEWLRAGNLFSAGASVRPETVYGNSRFDFYVEEGENRAFIEVKGVTLEEEGVVRFPDAPSERAVKHVEELIRAKKEGYDAYVFLVIQMKGVRYFTPNIDTQPEFAEALKKAKAAGVRILAYDCKVTEDSIQIDEEVPVVLEEPLLWEMTEPIVDWYRNNKRDLPWRHDVTPYRVWVSEIMLQQTRVEAVKPYYDRFLKELPTITDLAYAKEDRLMKLWEGLGYYNRVRNMQKAALQMVEQYGGEFPESYEEIRSLTGIGNYTAGAIGSFAFGIPKPAVDGNVLRVVSRILASREDIMKAKVRTAVERALEEVIPKEYPGDFNQGLIELGAIVCVPNGEPKCGECPVAAFCRARKEGIAVELPVKTKAKGRKIEKRTVLVFHDNDTLAIQKRPAKGLLAGLYELPNVEGWLSQKEIIEYSRSIGLSPIRVQKLPDAKHVFSHVEWQMKGYEIRVDELEKNCSQKMIFAKEEVLKEKYSIPSAFEAYCVWKQK